MGGYSPALAVATGIFEFAAAAWTLSRRGRKRFLHPAAALFLFLAGYQIAEVAVCAHPANLAWSRWAFFDITWLPPVGIWLVAALGFPGRLRPKIFAGGYFLLAAALSVWIFADPTCITRSVCQVVLARYGHPRVFELAYGVFYQFGLAAMVFMATAGMARTADTVLRKHLANVQAGVLGFVFPAFAVRVLTREPAGLMPSVMCHFALVLAVFLAALVGRESRLAAK
jgi:hypothetical protein